MCTAMDEIKPSIHFIVNCLNIKQEMFGIVCLHELSSPWHGNEGLMAIAIDCLLFYAILAV